MRAWEKPSRLPRQRASSNESLSWRERLAAAVVAPFIFNVSLFLLFGMFFRGRRGLIGLLFLPPIAFAVLLVVPATVGLVVGIDRFATFLGHSFYTNSAAERDVRITVAIWAGLLACTYVLSAFAT
jgi:hypothetical protein